MNRPTVAVLLRRPAPFSISLRHAAVAAGLVVMLAGCGTQPQTVPALDTTKYTLENTDRFLMLDRVAVTCTGLQDRPLADGRLEVIANLKNRSAERVTVQASCVFKDEATNATIEESPWQTVTIPENATEAVRFAATTNAPRMYTIRVRAPR